MAVMGAGNQAIGRMEIQGLAKTGNRCQPRYATTAVVGIQGKWEYAGYVRLAAMEPR